MATLAVFAVIFFVLLFKSYADATYELDQHWHQAFVDFDLNWKTPKFSFAGNLLNHFGIQPPLNADLMPVLAIAHLFPIGDRIVVSIILYFFATIALFWALARTWGLSSVPALVLAGSVALLTTITEGIVDLFGLPKSLLPYKNFVDLSFLALWWREASLLFTATVLAFFWLGRLQSLVGNIAVGLGFAAGTFAVVLSYPLGAVYFVPLTAIYCLVLLLTSTNRREFLWKTVPAAILIMMMIAIAVPQFLLNLYSYTYGSYFLDALRMSTDDLLQNDPIFIRPVDYSRFRIYVIGSAVMLIAALKPSKPQGRFAIAVLCSEIAFSGSAVLNALTMRAPMDLNYAEMANAPFVISYLALAVISFVMFFDRMVAAFVSRLSSPLLSRLFAYRAALCLGVALVATIRYAFIGPFQSHFSDYPPPTGVDKSAGAGDCTFSGINIPGTIADARRYGRRC